MKKRNLLILVLAALFLLTTPAAAKPIANSSILSVVEDQTVTVRLENFPEDETFNVLMGFNGTLGMNGYLVSRLATNAGGTFSAKFYIPEDLKGEDIIAIRFESQDSNVYCYNWFYNTTAATNPVEVDETTYNNLKPGFPTFTITKVVKGSSIELMTRYFPAGDRWAVMIKDGAMANKDWIDVAGIDVAEGGSFPVSFSIPSKLQYSEKLAIMFYRLKDGFRTYDLILNQDYP